jgi:hypothetical protein
VSFYIKNFILFKKTQGSMTSINASYSSFEKIVDTDFLKTKLRLT